MGKEGNLPDSENQAQNFINTSLNRQTIEVLTTTQKPEKQDRRNQTLTRITQSLDALTPPTTTIVVQKLLGSLRTAEHITLESTWWNATNKKDAALQILELVDYDRTDTSSVYRSYAGMIPGLTADARYLGATRALLLAGQIFAGKIARASDDNSKLRNAQDNADDKWDAVLRSLKIEYAHDQNIIREIEDGIKRIRYKINTHEDIPPTNAIRIPAGMVETSRYLPH